MRFALLVAAAAFTATLGAAPVLGQTDELPDVSAMSPAEVIDLRQSTMRSHGGTLRGAMQADPAQAIAIGEQMVYNATLMLELFPEGSESGGTREAIWTDRENFEAQLSNFLDLSETLLATAEAGDGEGFQAAFRDLAQSCNVCHATYRN